MRRVIVIGATGHIGSFLIPRLVRAGHQVVAVSRGRRAPYVDDPAWHDVERVERVMLDREADPEGFHAAIRELVGDAEQDVVVDLTTFTVAEAEPLLDAVRGRIARLVHCGTIWVHGPSLVVPTTEDDPRRPIGDYGTNKAAIEDLLAAEADRPDGVASVVLRPGHITGPGWPMVNPVGNLDLEVWERLARGRPVTMPELGIPTLNHVHADDVAQAFALAVEAPEIVPGRAFNIVAPRSMTMRGLAEGVAAWFEREADLRYVSVDEFRAQTTPAFGDASFEHLRRSHTMSIDRARRELAYDPAYTSLAAVGEALAQLAEDGAVDLGGADPALIRERSRANR